MIDPEEHPELVPPLDEDEEREYELAMHRLQERLFAEEEDGEFQVDEFASDEFEAALLEAMTTPVDMRFQNWLTAIGVPGSCIPSPIYGAIWTEMSEEEKDRYRDSDSEATD